MSLISWNIFKFCVILFQKMLASLTDRTLGTKKELTDLEKKLKASIDEIKSLIAQNSSEITDLKVKVNDLTRKVNSNQGRPGFSGGNVPGIMYKQI